MTPNVMDRAKIVIRSSSMAKALRTWMSRSSKGRSANEGEVIVDINIDKNEKTKIHRIYFEGNEN